MYLLGGSLAWVDFTGQTPFLLASPLMAAQRR
jgi:hypothetical protein